MQVKLEQLEPTKVKLSIVADKDELSATKKSVLSSLGKNVRVPGFRAGKAPEHLLEKQLSQSSVQAEFLDQVINELYPKAVTQEKLRTISQPQVSVTKFVPYSTMEFTAEIEVVGEVKLGDYKKVKQALKKVEVSAAEINTVVDNLRQRAASKKEVKRAAKAGDETVINFKGTDAASAEPISGADGQDYPLVIGSKNFIPGFEDELVGLKAGETKSFTLTFPKDYAVPDLQKRKVKFEVEVVRVEELKLPAADNAFAASIGKFDSISQLKADIKKQLTLEKEQESRAVYESELLSKIAGQSEVAFPKTLTDSEIENIEENAKRNCINRGQTWEEYLSSEGLSAEEFREKQRPIAEARIKSGLVLAEVAQREKVSVSPEEFEERIKLMKNQYSDPAMLEEIDKPQNRRDILNRLLTEKTLNLLGTFAARSKS